MTSQVAGDEQPERLDGAAVTAGLMGLLGARPAIGRSFTAADDRDGSAGTILLSDALWRRRYGGDAGVLGRTVRLDGAPFTVIGVMPPGFAFPSRTTEFWKTERFSEEDFTDRGNNYLRVLARLAPADDLPAGARRDALDRRPAGTPVARRRTGASGSP